MSQMTPRELDRAADLAERRPAYLAWVFAQYARIQQTTHAALAEELGVSDMDYLRMRLHLRPRPEQFEADMRQTAAAFGADAARLAAVVRLVDAVQAMTADAATKASAEAGLLMAARSRQRRANRSGEGGPA